MRSLVLLFLAALLAACAAPRAGVSAEFMLDPAKRSGLVVGTITYASATGVYGVSWRAEQGAPFGAVVGYPLWPPLGPEYDDLVPMIVPLKR